MFEHYPLSTLLLPWLTLLIVALALIALDRLFARIRPQAKIQRILFDKKFRDRHAVYFVLNWCSVIALWIVCYSVMYTLAF